MTRDVQLIKAPAHLYDWQKRKKSEERFERGERIITVDGVRWGRTHVTWHGCHGTRTTFSQDNGGTIVEGKHDHDVTVRTMHRSERRVWKDHKLIPNPEWKTNEELALIKARELVESGKLRDPAIVAVENEERRKRYEARQAERQAEEDKVFRAKALEACGYSAEPNDPDTRAMVDRVVSAMRWAQSK